MGEYLYFFFWASGMSNHESKNKLLQKNVSSSEENCYCERVKASWEPNKNKQTIYVGFAILYAYIPIFK